MRSKNATIMGAGVDPDKRDERADRSPDRDGERRRDPREGDQPEDDKTLPPPESYPPIVEYDD